MGEKVIKFCAFVLFLLCIYMAISKFGDAVEHGIVSAVFDVLFAAIWAIFAGIICWYLFCPGLSEAFTNAVFGGRDTLDKTPLILSDVRGLIAAGDIEEAAIAIQELYAQYPLAPELNLLMFEFYLDCCGKREFAMNLGKNYLQSARICSSDNIQILLRYCDLCAADGMDKDELIDFLLDQSVKNIYPEIDKKRIFARVKGLN